MTLPSSAFPAVSIGDLARRAYQAHARLLGLPTVAWDALPRREQLAWLAVACAVLRGKAEDVA